VRFGSALFDCPYWTSVRSLVPWWFSIQVMRSESHLPISHQEWHNNANDFRQPSGYPRPPAITSRSCCENVRTLNCQLSRFLGPLMSDFWWLLMTGWRKKGQIIIREMLITVGATRMSRYLAHCSSRNWRINVNRQPGMTDYRNPDLVQMQAHQ